MLIGLESKSFFSVKHYIVILILILLQRLAGGFMFFLKAQATIEVIYGLSKLMIQIYLAVEVKKQETHQPGFQHGGFQQVPLHAYPNPNPPIVLNIQQHPQPLTQYLK